MNAPSRVPAVWKLPGSRRKTGSTIFVHVFADDSDSFGATGFICLAGYIATDERWLAFQDVWEDTLNRHGLTHIHTSDFLAGQGPYASLGWDYPKRLSVLQEFMNIIREHVECGVFSAFNAGEYREIMKQYKKKMSAEMWLFRRIIKRSFEHMVETKSKETIQFWFDDSSKSSHHFLSAWNDIKKNWKFAKTMLGGIGFYDDENIPQIQAADVLANALTRSHRAGRLPWDPKGEFFPLFVDPLTMRPSNRMRGELWESSDIEKHAPEILAASQPN